MRGRLWIMGTCLTRGGNLGLQTAVERRTPGAELVDGSRPIIDGKSGGGVVLELKLDAVASLILLLEPDAVFVVDRGDFGLLASQSAKAVAIRLKMLGTHIQWAGHHGIRHAPGARS